MATTKDTDFYVVIDFKKMRGVRVVDMEDKDGEMSTCAVIPLLKNAMKNWGAGKWRMILAARKSNRKENASHVLIPQCDKDIVKAMAAAHISRVQGKYIAPIVGDIVIDLSQIPCPPTFLVGTPIAEAMEENKVENTSGIVVNKVEESQPQERKLSALQIQLREKLLKK